MSLGFGPVRLPPGAQPRQRLATHQPAEARGVSQALGFRGFAFEAEFRVWGLAFGALDVGCRV